MRKYQHKSKFVGKEFDNNWICTGINVASTTSTHKNGGPNYWYAFERKTTDGKFDKWIRVSATQATKIWKGELTVEEVNNLQKKHNSGVYKINYQFSD